MGTDCKSAAFSFGGSNPPAPTKRSSIRTGYWIFCFADFSQGWAGGFEQQQRRPLPAAETGRSCWGCGQQDARAAQGTMQPLGAATRAPFLRGSRNPPAPTHLTASVCKHTGAVLFLSAQGCSGMQHILEVEKNGACVTNLSQKGYKRPFCPRKDCEMIVYLVSYRGGWPIVPVCEKK